MKVISIVLNNFTNDSRVLKEALTLSRFGYEVTIIALHEGSLKEEESIDKIKLKRIRLFTKKWSNNLIVQIIKYLELTMRIIKKYRKTDLIHCNDLAPLPIAVLIKYLSFNKVKIIYDAHEYETEINGLKGVRKKLLSILEKYLIRKVDKVITVSESIADEYVRLYNIDRPSVVMNCPMHNDLEKQNIFREKFKIAKEDVIFLYQGGLTTGRGLDLLLKTFSKIDDGSCLVIMGYGPLKEQVIEYVNKYKNIFLHEAVSPSELPYYTSSADVGICIIEDICLSYRYSLPNKFFEYALSGLPIITNNLIETKKIVQKYNCGWVLEEMKPDELKTLILSLNKNLVASRTVNLEKLSKEYSWETQGEKLIEIYSEIKI